MSLLQVRRLPPQVLLVWEHPERIRQDRTRGTDVPFRLRRLRVARPRVEPILLLDVHRDRRFDDRLARPERALVLAPLRLPQPLVAREQHLVPPQLAHARLDRLVDDRELLVALLRRLLGRVRLLFEQPAGSDPDLVRGGDGFAGFVQDGLSLVGGFQTRECEPELDGLWDDLYSA